MKLGGVGRCTAFCVVVALMFGLVAQGFVAATMSATLLTAAGARYVTAPPPGCNGCSSDDGAMSTAACNAVCGAAAAILPCTTAVTLLVAAQPTAVPVRFARGRNGPPDPYPPKRPILS